MIGCTRVYYETIDKIENNGVKKQGSPQSARLRNYSYSIALYIDVDVTVNVKDDSLTELPPHSLKGVLIGKFRLLWVVHDVLHVINPNELIVQTMILVDTLY